MLTPVRMSAQDGHHTSLAEVGGMAGRSNSDRPVADYSLHAQASLPPLSNKVDMQVEVLVLVVVHSLCSLWH
jgi:hypothetical protein